MRLPWDGTFAGDPASPSRLSREERVGAGVSMKCVYERRRSTENGMEKI